MSQYSFLKVQKDSTHSVGSIEVQVSFLTAKVSNLSSHLEIHNKDYSSQRGLKKLLGKRKRLLSYLARENAARYESLIRQLGIRVMKTYLTN